MLRKADAPAILVHETIVLGYQRITVLQIAIARIDPLLITAASAIGKPASTPVTVRLRVLDRIRLLESKCHRLKIEDRFVCLLQKIDA